MELGIIDVSIKGNLIRVYMGNINKDWWGDDWDDTPYEHNCELVYDEFVKEYFDIVIPFEYDIYEPSYHFMNSIWCRDDFKTGNIPLFYALNKNEFINVGEFREGKWKEYPHLRMRDSVEAIRKFVDEEIKGTIDAKFDKIYNKYEYFSVKNGGEEVLI